jgi:peptidoglycan/xylan/chitin deacetylase (PgdA/CDA1 family)
MRRQGGSRVVSQRSFVARRRHLEVRPARGFADIARHAFARVALPSVATRGLGVYAVRTETQAFALTFDDGPSAAHTPGILDTLDRYGAKATFFVLAQRVAENPSILTDIAARGHEIGLHGGDHVSLLTVSRADALSQISAARRSVESALGSPVGLYRPPYGHHTWAQGRGIHGLGLEIVQWSGDAVDWLDGDPDDIAARLDAVCAPGAVLLLHDDRADPETLRQGEALPAFDKALLVDRFLARQAARGLRAVTVGGLLSRGTAVRSTSKDGMGWR